MFHIAFHTMKYYNWSYGRVTQDDDEDPQLLAQIMHDVLSVVAPSDMAVSYSVYMVGCYDQDELVAYKVYSLIKCVEPESISSELSSHLETVLKERGLFNMFGLGSLSEVTRQEFDRISEKHRQDQV